MSNKSFKVITTSRSDFKQKIKIPKKLMNPNTERLIKRTTVVGTLVAAYLLLTADYGPQPNVLDPIRNTILSAQRSVKESILGTKKKPEDSDARKVGSNSKKENP